MNITIKYPTSRPTSEVATLKNWGGSMTADTFSTSVRLVAGKPMGQFALINVARFAGSTFVDWGGNSGSVALTLNQYLRIASLQDTDTPVAVKVGWLMYGGQDTWGAPMKGLYPDTARWMQATNIRMISAVYAGQQVEILERKPMTVFWNGKRETVTMCRVKDYAPDTWNAANMILVSVVDAADRPGTMPNANVGRVKLPVWFGGYSGWVMERWLM